jgi:heme exporter protein A
MRLTATGLSAVRGGRTLFEGLSFAVDAGELLAVTGPNGAGKSTLLRLIAGLLTPAAGRMEMTGADVDEPAIHYLGHLDALKAGFTVRENLAFWSRLWGSASIAPALAAEGVAALASLPVSALSAGQRRRVALARLRLAWRPLWLLDEPATALDAAAEAALGALIADHLGQGGVVVAATHRDLPLRPAATLELGR